MSRVFTALFGAVFLITAAACGEPDAKITSKAQLDEKLQSVASWNRVSGFAVSVFDADGVIFQNAYGYSDVDAKTLYTLDTKQTIASISKVTIGIALMKAAELGHIELDDPINKYLPFTVTNPHFPDDAITIRHLAMHTSSIAYSEQMTDERVYENREMPIGTFLKTYLVEGGDWYSGENFHQKRPGKLGDYTNVGAALAAYILEQATGQSFDAFTKQHIFMPLVLENTHWYRSENSDSDVMYYATLAKADFTAKPRRATTLYPVDGLVTNAQDLTTLCQMIMKGGGEILSKSSVNEMLDVKKIRSLDDEIEKQGIFWYSTKGQLGIPKTVVGHSGGDDSSFTMMFFDPKTNTGYILLSNTAMSESAHLALFNAYKSLWLYTKHRQD